MTANEFDIVEKLMAACWRRDDIAVMLLLAALKARQSEIETDAHRIA
jgi:hypothetical protein